MYNPNITKFVTSKGKAKLPTSKGSISTLPSKPPSVLKINAGNITEIKLKRTRMRVGKKIIHETWFCFNFDLKLFFSNLIPKINEANGLDKL